MKNRRLRAAAIEELDIEHQVRSLDLQAAGL
jgi:hypothetical protein